jgi:hypothetical protein
MGYEVTKNVHNFVFNEEDNGGEALELTTYKHTDTRYNESFFTQELTLHSYGNSATFKFSAFMTPEKLRKLADALEKVIDSQE